LYPIASHVPLIVKAYGAGGVFSGSPRMEKHEMADGRLIMATQTAQAPKSGWGLPRTIAVGVLGAALAFSAVWVVAGPGPSEEERREELLAYLDQLKPLTEEAGTVVIHGLRAGVNDIPARRFEDELLIRQTRGWRRDLTSIQERLEAVRPPKNLVEAHATLSKSLSGYIEVTHSLEEAAGVADDAERKRLSSLAASRGEEMDRLWNVGAFVIQHELVALGEDMVIWLPDPTVNPDGDDYVDGDPDEENPNDFIPRETPTS